MSIPRSVPESLARATLAMRGPAGAEWLERLPSLVAECEHRWSLEAGSPFDVLSVNWVAPAMVRGAEASAVLKLVFPRDKEFVMEAAALGPSTDVEPPGCSGSTSNAARCFSRGASPARRSSPWMTTWRPRPSPRG